MGIARRHGQRGGWCALDPQLAKLLLREHARRLPGAPDKRKAQRTTAQAASNKEIAAALVKRLRAFSLRMGSGQALGVSADRADPPPNPLPFAGEGEE